jgi:hypothetical protein
MISSERFSNLLLETDSHIIRIFFCLKLIHRLSDFATEFLFVVISTYLKALVIGTLHMIH